MQDIQLEYQQQRESEYNKIYKTSKELIVYVNKKQQKYYISMSAACELNLISYEQYVSNDKGYYEISLRQLEEFRELYEIIYKYFVEEKKYRHSFNKVFDINSYSNENISKTNKELNELRALRDDLTEKNIIDKDLSINNKCNPKK